VIKGEVIEFDGKAYMIFRSFHQGKGQGNELPKAIKDIVNAIFKDSIKDIVLSN